MTKKRNSKDEYELEFDFFIFFLKRKTNQNRILSKSNPRPVTDQRLRYDVSSCSPCHGAVAKMPWASPDEPMETGSFLEGLPARLAPTSEYPQTLVV